MKILVVGAGAIGGYYGARLLQAGADVTFLVRPGRAAALAADGLRVRSPLGDFDGPVVTVARDGLAADYDLVLLSCKAFDLEAALEDIGPAMQGRAAVLPFLNGLAVYDRLDARFGRDRVLGGAAYVAVILDPQGVVCHLSDADVVIVGARSDAAAAAAAATARAFHGLIARSPGERTLSTDMEQALWNKWVMLATGALMTCLMRGTVGAILATRDGEALMKQALAECLAVAAAEGMRLPAPDVQRLQARLLDRQSGWAASMMRDIAQGAGRIEAQAIVGDMCARAQRHGVDAVLLRTAYCHLQVYEASVSGPR